MISRPSSHLTITAGMLCLCATLGCATPAFDEPTLEASTPTCEWALASHGKLPVAPRPYSEVEIAERADGRPLVLFSVPGAPSATGSEPIAVAWSLNDDGEWYEVHRVPDVVSVRAVTGRRADAFATQRANQSRIVQQGADGRWTETKFADEATEYKPLFATADGRLELALREEKRAHTAGPLWHYHRAGDRALFGVADQRYEVFTDDKRKLYEGRGKPEHIESILREDGFAAVAVEAHDTNGGRAISLQTTAGYAAKVAQTDAMPPFPADCDAPGACQARWRRAELIALVDTRQPIALVLQSTAHLEATHMGGSGPGPGPLVWGVSAQKDLQLQLSGPGPAQTVKIPQELAGMRFAATSLTPGQIRLVAHRSGDAEGKIHHLRLACVAGKSPVE